MITASLSENSSLAEPVQSLLATVECLRNEVAELRQENSVLKQQVRELRCDVGYWKSRHADAVQRNVKLQAELDQAKAEIRQLKSERFGKRSEKQSSSDRMTMSRLKSRQSSIAELSNANAIAERVAVKVRPKCSSQRCHRSCFPKASTARASGLIYC